jgi:tetratricopeptide (TPR) repeat protein
LDADDYVKALAAFRACYEFLPEGQRTEITLAASKAMEEYGEMDEAVMLLMRREKELEPKEGGKSRELAQVHMRHAQALFRKSLFDQAMEHCNLALAIFTEDEVSAKDAVVVTTTMGMIMWEKGDYEMALKFLQQALTKAEQSGDEEKIANVNNSLGLVNYQLGNYHQALKYYGTARVHAKGNTSLILLIENNTGLVHHDMGDYTIAKMYYDRCLQLSDEIEHFLSMALAHLNLGLLAIDTGRPDEGRDLIEESLSLCRHMKEKWVQALNRIGLARAYLIKGNLLLARHNAEQALMLAEDMKAKESKGMALRELGRIDMLEDHKDDARRRLEESVALFEAMHNRFELAKSLIALGAFQVVEGNDVATGKKNLERALTISIEIGAKGVQKEAERAIGEVQT